MKKAFKNFTHKPTLIIGSGPSALDVSRKDLAGIRTAAINNAWRVRNDFNYLLFPSDFPEDRRAPPSYKARRITNPDYLAGMNAGGGLIFCGATMAFAAGYWAAHSLRTQIVGFYAADMIYPAKGSHFYGTGTADPLREDISLRSLEAKGVRLFSFGLSRGVVLVNCSQQAESRLVFPRVDLDKLSEFETHPKEWVELRRAAKDALQFEAQAPFDRMCEEYWTLADTPEKIEFIDKVDQKWLSLLELI
ncbi:hypothetical protein H0176_28835 [Methylorubrum populi]|jgi:hypothetical protein|uniref:hypothetical protein n=1 Tax=Methylorubrum rhodesianum TaxID=29427 RepID=UPI0019092474|nr:hypothetical protein [Methylorubrum rhodesianum]MBK3402797.1 hypothetical protein [Methylorubrum rhodesianum]MBY0144212.1 hypothetical protein [Methylorubrum populi]